ncbi:response regulator transcription factor [Paenibacillus lycopersici]|uniref:Response regulator transcription factor n=1 Tax=Paenibacillus lycopersici TaxID=2704462 RepID=A0A6C0FRM5_9BACL|nr:response regulator transcription factor [Paenibacillus lycopersici]QHT59806.1 response regulator transcription factor [Paenibacillus lycopersici]
MIRIGIAEDQTLIRESLAIVLGLEIDIEVSWTAATGAEAVSRMASEPADVVLMDLRMPGLDGASAMRRIRSQTPEARFIVLTTFRHDEWLMEAIDAGAAACLLKEVPPELLIEAVRGVVRGDWDPERWTPDWRKYAPELQFRMRLSSPSIAGGPDALSSRELSILGKLCAGATNKEISADLHLTEGTVKNYVSALYAKLGVRHRAEAVKIARERALV